MDLQFKQEDLLEMVVLDLLTEQQELLEPAMLAGELDMQLVAAAVDPPTQAAPVVQVVPAS